jgi:hypothetical protein
MIGLKYFLVSQKYSKCQIKLKLKALKRTKKFNFFSKLFVVPSSEFGVRVIIIKIFFFSRQFKQYLWGQSQVNLEEDASQQFGNYIANFCWALIIQFFKCMSIFILNPFTPPPTTVHYSFQFIASIESQCLYSIIIVPFSKVTRTATKAIQRNIRMMSLKYALKCIPSAQILLWH